MGKPHGTNFRDLSLKRREELTLGSETSQYQEEKRTIVIPLVAASETGSAQTQPQYIYVNASSYIDIGDGGHKATALVIGRVKNCLSRGRKSLRGLDRGTHWEVRPQRVIVPYTKTKQLYGCSS